VHTVRPDGDQIEEENREQASVCQPADEKPLHPRLQSELIDRLAALLALIPCPLSSLSSFHRQNTQQIDGKTGRSNVEKQYHAAARCVRAEGCRGRRAL
jgi:hypothetical protein